MKKTILLWLMVLMTSAFFSACNERSTDDDEVDTSYFLSDLRPRFFEALNFNSAERIAEIPDFLEEFGATYRKLEEEYEGGLYTDSRDLNHIRLTGMYYSFYLTATVRGYLDGFINFEDIIGDRTTFFSGLQPSDPDFQQKELKAMMTRSQKVANFATNVNGFNDKTYATFMVSRQINGRVDSPHDYNNPFTQDSMIAYVSSTIYDYDLFQNWNVLMSQLSFTNFHDSLNTFKNPQMDVVLKNLNDRLILGAIPDLNARYAEILGPTFRFDLNMKKVNWMINDQEEMSKEQIAELDTYIRMMDTLSNHVLYDKTVLLDSWNHKETITEVRIDRLNELKAYRESLDTETPLPKPELSPHFTSKEFLQAYQCYNCHQDVKL
ncbi:MAG: hypothetical protein AAFP19_03755 [Bacteroidota bacterium]